MGVLSLEEFDQLMSKASPTAWVVIILTSALIILITTLAPVRQSSRDRILQENLNVTQLESRLTPQDLCKLALGANFGTVNCNTADTRYLAADNSKNIDAAKEEVMASLKVYQVLLERIRASDLASENLPVITNFEQKIQALSSALRQLPGAGSGEANRLMFEALLVEQGYSYNPYTSKFKKTNHNIARYAESPTQVGEQLDRLDYVAKYFGVAFAALTFVTLFLLGQKVQTTGLLLFALFLLAESLSFVVVRDAAQNYALGLADYGLNPFRETLERQSLIITFATFVAFAGVVFGADPKTTRINVRPGIRDGLMPFALLLLALAAYTFFGPAIGSESLKIIICLICAGFLARFGRSLELLFDVLGRGVLDILRLQDIFNALSKFSRRAESLTTGQYLHVFLVRSVFLRVLALGASILVVTTVFGDLGGALIALLVFFFSLYLLLGIRFALSVAGLLAIASLGLYLVSAKVQSRVQLMLEPMHANVSDFGRLLQFEASSRPNGYGIGHIKWCSNDSVCIPLQSLSDYMPTIVNASLGTWYASAFYLVFITGLLWLSYRTFMKCWVYGARYRGVSIFAALLCMSALFQLLITLMGNLRVMPLTGLGLPLMSIGISSFVSVSLGLGLATGLVFKK